MFRTVRALVIAVVVAVSLLGSASFASADTGPTIGAAQIRIPAPLPFDIYWE